MSMSSMQGREMELATIALSAYQQADFETAIKYFAERCRRDRAPWECRVFLIMKSCAGNALQELKEMDEGCLDNAIKDKALEALQTSHSHDKLNALTKKAL